jgi:hypothetical protein
MTDALTRRLQALEDERAVIRTLHRYGHAIDAGDEEAWLACFTEDAVFRAGGRRSRETRFVVSGRDELRAFIAGHTRRPDAFHQHHVLEPLVTVDGAAAECVSGFIVVMEHGDRPVVRVFGRYHDRLVREPDGVWRFAERVAHIDSSRPGLPPLAWGRDRR